MSQHALWQPAAAAGGVALGRLAARVTDDRFAAQVVLMSALQGATEQHSQTGSAFRSARRRENNLPPPPPPPHYHPPGTRSGSPSSSPSPRQTERLRGEKERGEEEEAESEKGDEQQEEE